MEYCEKEKQLSFNCRKCIVLALGANVPGHWGNPQETLTKAIQLLACHGLKHTSVSPWYATKVYGQIRQPPFLNLVLVARQDDGCALSPRQCIDIAKKLERMAGRRLLSRNGPRPLDIDLIDYAGRIINWHHGMKRPKLVLPHPLAAWRPFVLVPLADAAPKWRHPVLQLTARELLHRQGGRHRVMLRREMSRFPTVSAMKT